MIKCVWLASLGLFLGTSVNAFADLDFQVAVELLDDDGDGVIEFDIAGMGELATSPNLDDKTKKLTAEQERTLDEFTAKVRDIWLKNNEEKLKATFNRFMQTNQLSKEEQAKLTEVVPDAIKAIASEWKAKCAEWLRPYVMTENSGDVLNQWQAEQIAQSSNGYVFVPILDNKAWTEGLKKNLPAEKLVEIEKTAKERIAKMLDGMKDGLSGHEDMLKEQYSQAMETQVKRSVQDSGLDEERAKKLKQASEEAVKSAVAAWRVRAEKKIATLSESELAIFKKRLAQRGGDLLGADGRDKDLMPQEQKVWKDALATIITDEERKVLAEKKEKLRAHRSSALAHVVLAELDSLLGFTDAQRKALMDVGAKEMLKLPDYYYERADTNRGYTSLNMQLMATTLQKMDTKTVEGILDESQMKRWKALKPEMLGQNNGSRVVRETNKKDKPAPPADAIEAEQMISEMLYKQSKATRDRASNIMQSKLELVSAMLKISPEVKARLSTAAKGGAEWIAQNSLQQSEQYARQQLQGVAAEQLAARLAEFSMPNFGRRPKEPDPPMWVTAVDQSLDDNQKKVWQAAADDRAKWLQSGVSTFIVSEVEKNVPLKQEQIDKLREKVSAIIIDYQTDIENYFSTGWHLQGYYNMVPVALIPEKEMAELFSKAELDILKDSMAYANNYVESLRQQHDQRVKRDTKKETKE